MAENRMVTERDDFTKIEDDFHTSKKDSHLHLSSKYKYGNT